MNLVGLLARATSPWVWRTPMRSARMLHSFAHAEQGSMLDIRLAATATPSTARAAAYLRHADDEARHCVMFTRRCAQLAAQAGSANKLLPPVRADCERLFEQLGELDFLAFVHWGEARAIRQFHAYIDYFEAQGRQGDATLLKTILVDENRHAAYTRELLVELAGSEHEAQRAIGRVRRWELWRTWLRKGRFLAEHVYTLAMLMVYVLAAPLSLLLRLARPARAGFRALAPSGETINSTGKSS